MIYNRNDVLERLYKSREDSARLLPDTLDVVERLSNLIDRVMKEPQFSEPFREVSAQEAFDRLVERYDLTDSEAYSLHYNRFTDRPAREAAIEPAPQPA